MNLPDGVMIHHEFTIPQLQTLFYLATTCCALSLLLTLALMINFLRKICVLKKFLGSRLIFYISLSELLTAVFRLCMWVNYEKSEDDKFCLIQAYLINMSQLSSILWSNAICWLLYKTVIFNDLEIRNKEATFLLCCYGFPIAYAMIPIFTGSYGPTETWCWLNYKNPTFENIFVKVIELYVPVCLVFTMNSFLLCRISRFLKEHAREEFPRAIIYKLKGYAVCLFAIWLTVVIHRLFNLFDKGSIVLFTLTIINDTLMNLSGCINYLVYGYETSYIHKCIVCLRKGFSKRDGLESVDHTPSIYEDEVEGKSHYTLDSFGDPTRRTLLYNNFSDDF